MARGFSDNQGPVEVTLGKYTPPAGAIDVSPGAPMGPHPTLTVGSTGPAVVQWQNIVAQNPDGKFGPKTRAATIKWQSDHGLVADGMVGPKTWSAAMARPVAAPNDPVVSQVLQQAGQAQDAVQRAAQATQQIAQAVQQQQQAKAVAATPPVTATLPVATAPSLFAAHPQILRYSASVLAGGVGFLINPIVGGVAAIGTFFFPKWRT